MKNTTRSSVRITPSYSGWLLCLLLAGALAAGCRKPAEPEKKQPSAVSVRVAHAEKRTLRPSFQVIGTVLASPDRQATLAAATPGLVESLTVQEGAKVKKGDPIVRLDERKAKIDLERAEAALARLIAKPRPEELAQATALVEKAKSAHGVALNRLKKTQDLRKRSPELVPEVQLLDDQRAEQAARADVETAQAQLDLLNKGPREEQRREAAVEVEATRLQLEYCRVTAPFDGEVVELLARAGMKADVGTPVARLIDTSEVIVQARLPGNRLVAVAATLNGSVGSPAEVRAGAFPGESFAVKSGFLNQQTEAQTSDVTVKFRVENPKRLLRIGMSVQVELREPAVEGIAIPEAAVAVNEEGHKVVTVVKDGKAVPTEIEVASDTEREVRAEGWVRVLKGIEVGDAVAVENGYALPKDTAVEVLPAKPTTPTGK